MGLEAATYIDDLVATNPTSTDPKNQGDDHLRLLKATIKASFPNITGAMTASHTELNYVVGVTSAIQTQIDAKGAIAGQVWTGTHNFSGATAVSLPAASTGATAASGDNSTKLATTAFAVQLAFQASLPAQSGNGGKLLTTDGSAASWTGPADQATAMRPRPGAGALVVRDAASARRRA